MIRNGLMLALVAAVLAATVGCRTTDVGGERKVTRPAAFPADVPLPEEGVLRTAQDLAERGCNLIWETRIKPDQAAVAYRERLARAGWRLVAEVKAENGVFMSFRKETQSLAVSVSPTDRGTGIGIAYAALP